MDGDAGPLRPATTDEEQVLETTAPPTPIDFNSNSHELNNSNSFDHLIKSGLTRLGFGAMSPWAKFAFYWSLTQFFIAGGLEAILASQNQDFVSQLETSTANFGIVSTISQSIANAKALTLYHGLVIVAHFFQFAMTWDAVVHSSLIQLVSTTFFNFAIFGYTFVQLNQASNIFSPEMAVYMQNNFPNIKLHPTFTLEIIIIGTMALFCIVSAFVTHKLYRVFGWSIFKQLGADIRVKNQLQWYHVYLLLLKLDVFFFLGFTLQYLVLVLINQRKDQTDIITHAAIGIPSCFGLLVIAYFAIRKQSKVLMMCTFVGLAIVTGYLVTKLIDIYQNSGSTKYLGSRNSLTFFESLTLVLCFVTAIVAYMNYKSFGTGVMNQINQAHDMQLAPLAHQTNSTATGSASRRDIEDPIVVGTPSSAQYDAVPTNGGVPQPYQNGNGMMRMMNTNAGPSPVLQGQGSPQQAYRFQQQQAPVIPSSAPMSYQQQQQQAYVYQQQQQQQQGYSPRYQQQQQQRWAIE